MAAKSSCYSSTLPLHPLNTLNLTQASQTAFRHPLNYGTETPQHAASYILAGVIRDPAKLGWVFLAGQAFGEKLSQSTMKLSQLFRHLLHQKLKTVPADLHIQCTNLFGKRKTYLISNPSSSTVPQKRVLPSIPGVHCQCSERFSSTGKIQSRINKQIPEFATFQRFPAVCSSTVKRVHISSDSQVKH